MIPGCWFNFWNEMGAPSALIRAAPHWVGGREGEKEETNCDYYDPERSSERTLFELLWLTGFWYSLIFHSQAYDNEFQAILTEE